MPIPINPIGSSVLGPRSFNTTVSPDPITLPPTTRKFIISEIRDYYRPITTGSDRVTMIMVSPWILPNGWVPSEGTASGYVNLNNTSNQEEILNRVYLGTDDTKQVVRIDYRTNQNPWIYNINARRVGYTQSLRLVGFEDLPSSPPKPDGSNVDYNDILIDIVGVRDNNLALFQNRRVIVGPYTQNLNLRAAISDDNISWITAITFAPDTPNQDLFDIVRGEASRYVALNDSNATRGSIIYSNDGATWFNSTLQDILIFNKITYGNGLFVANNTDSTLYVVSTDGVIFSSFILFTPLIKINRIRYGNGYWIAGTGDGTTSGRIFYTQNIISSNWIESTITINDPNIILRSIIDMAYGGQVGTWIAIGRGTFFGQPRVVLIYSKDDGKTWFNMNPSTFIGYDNTSNPLTNMAIIYANNRFSVVGGGSLVNASQTASYRSGRDENDNWSFRSLPINSANAINYRNEEYLIGGRNAPTRLNQPMLVRSTFGEIFTDVNIIINESTQRRFIINGIA